MIKYEYLKSPMYYINGIPANKAGEWPGIKSCKFENTRAIIQATSEGIVLNDSEPPLIPKKKLLGPPPSKEWEFRPGIKMVKQIRETHKKSRFEGILAPTKSEGRTFFKRKCYFQYKNDYIKAIQAKEAKFQLQNKLLNNNKDSNTSRAGFTKQFFDNISNNKLLGVTITKDSFNLMSKTMSLPKVKRNEYLKTTQNLWKQMEIKKITSMKMEQENLQRDINYVNSLRDIGNESD